jgi:hypothetical protein
LECAGTNKEVTYRLDLTMMRLRPPHLEVGTGSPVSNTVMYLIAPPTVMTRGLAGDEMMVLQEVPVCAYVAIGRPLLHWKGTVVLYYVPYHNIESGPQSQAAPRANAERRIAAMVVDWLQTAPRAGPPREPAARAAMGLRVQLLAWAYARPLVRGVDKVAKSYVSSAVSRMRARSSSADGNTANHLQLLPVLVMHRNSTVHCQGTFR